MAALMGMSDHGYVQWELGARRPGGPACRLPRLFDRDGSDVIEALRGMPG